jgi:hypothetical protein
MSRNSAYKLRKKPMAESFAAAWDAALGLRVRKVTIDDLHYLAYQGVVRPRFRAGKYIGSRQKPDNSALLRLLARFERISSGEGRWRKVTVFSTARCVSAKMTRESFFGSPCHTGEPCLVKQVGTNERN